MASRAALGLSLALACAAGLAGSVMMYTEAPRVLTRIKDVNLITDGQVDPVKWEIYKKDVTTFLKLAKDDDPLKECLDRTLNNISQYDQDMKYTSELKEIIYANTDSKVVREIPTRNILINHTATPRLEAQSAEERETTKREIEDYIKQFGVSQMVAGLPRTVSRVWSEEEAADLLDMMVRIEPGSQFNDDRKYISWLYRQDEVPFAEVIPELLEIPKVKAAIGKKKIWVCFRQYLKEQSQDLLVVQDITSNRDDVLFVLSLYTQEEIPTGIPEDKLVFHRIKNRPPGILDGALPIDLFFDEDGILQYGIQDNSLMYRILRMQPYGHPSRS
ncbi:MAG: hypothetical protein KDC26_12610 [Armatimonadetes bacterium]|nr:hypothetical protein [Armatimonadota bacterium]